MYMFNPLKAIDTPVISKILLNLFTALIILVIGLIIGNLTYKIVKKLLHGFEINKILKEE